MDNWNDYIHKRFGNIEGLELSRDSEYPGVGFRLHSTNPEIETAIYFFEPHDHLAQVGCYGKKPSQGINELTFALPFDAENVAALDHDLWAIITTGWDEVHFISSSNTPYKVLFHVRGGRRITYHIGCLFPLLDTITFGLISRSTTQQTIVVEPMLRQAIDVPPLDL